MQINIPLKKKKSFQRSGKKPTSTTTKILHSKITCEGLLISSSLKSLIQSSCLTDIQSVDLHCLKKKKGTPNK